VEGFNEGEGLRLSRVVNSFDEDEDVFLVIYKAGRTAQGKDAAKGHTGVLLPVYICWCVYMRVRVRLG
jgi:acyl-CoA synthetase (NDP forming)